MKKEKWMDLKVDDKLVYLLKLALENNDSKILFRLSDIVEKRATFEWKLEELIRDLQEVKQ